MLVRRATTVAVTVSATVFAALISIAVAAAYSSAWQFRRYDAASFRHMAQVARQHGLQPPPRLSVPAPRLHDAVTAVVSEALLLLVLATVALLLARGGRRWLWAGVAALPFLGYHAQFPSLLLLWGQRPDADPYPAIWAARVAWAVALAAGPAVLVALAGRRLPRPSVSAPRAVLRLAGPALVVALVAWLTTASDDRVTAVTGAAIALAAFGLVATSGYHYRLLAVTGVWALLAVAGLVERYALGSPDAWLASAWLPVAALAALGVVAANGSLGRLWVRLTRRGPAVRAPRPLRGAAG